MTARPYALVLGSDRATREAHCRDLTRAGYQPVAFDACSEALAWLEEETPVVAVLVVPSGETCSRLVEALKEREVALLPASGQEVGAVL